MPGLYTHTTRATGTVLTAAIYNADHNNHIDNHIPSQMDDYSSNATTMQATTDPGESGSESLATSLAGELERLRFAIQDVKSGLGLTSAQWYSTLTGTIDDAKIDDHSSNATEMQATADPGESGSESLATDLGGEFERIRFMLKELGAILNGGSLSQWYTSLTKLYFKRVEETRTAANTGTAYTLDLDTANNFELTLTGSPAVLTFSNPAASGRAHSFTVALIQDGTGNRLVTWPGSVVWASGVAPTLTTTASKRDFFSFVTYDGGTTWYGFNSGFNF